ncbi:response regulator transcription factor [Devosia psychrophila]|jgi:two-component system OmpR family response regulator|uniref:Response regulator receiver domain-containing protein n=1 Tax=Devosia psychrophila TaxID=728005 RepID=A0A0F5PZQ6_9HYPH|nr:response regulator transcription factor [Devosia psychrophila]KKC33886.1 XRE family transcriptional regulator [Devosia psychrophila]SFD10923.1 Response regulator receiver domain-containing protein [Devosia psychrophila]
MRILFVEDDARTADYVKRGLTEAGHVADVIADGRDALVHGMAERFDVMVVDRMLPGLDGLSLVKAFRASGNTTPVLFLTAVGGVDDRVDGLEAGGDDYLVKPFAFSELLARLNALARRPPPTTEKTKLQVADLEIDLIRHSCRRGTMAIDLLPREFALLTYLMQNENRVLTRTMLLERVWDFHFDPQTSVVETHISRLRAKIDKPFAKPLLHTIRSTGYSLHA